MTQITETIPDARPEWFEKGLKDGDLFSKAIEIFKEQESRIAELEELLNGAA